MKIRPLLAFLTLLTLLTASGCSLSPSSLLATLPVSGQAHRPVPDMEHSILADRTPWMSSETLFEVPGSAWETVQGSELYRFHDRLLTTYYRYDSQAKNSVYHMALVSLKDGSVLAQAALDDTGDPLIQILEDEIALLDRTQKTVRLFDQDLQQTQEYTLPCELFALDLRAKQAYLFPEEGGISALDLKTGQQTTLLEQARSIQLTEVGDDHAAFTYVDTQTLRKTGAVLDLSTGTLIPFPLDQSPSWVEYTQDTWMTRLHSENEIYAIGQTDSLALLHLQGTATISQIGGSAHLLTKTTNEAWEPVFTLHDQDSSYLSTATLSGTYGAPFGDLVWVEEYNGYFFTATSTQDGRDHLLFWDLSIETAGESLTLEGLETFDPIPQGTALPAAYYQRAQALSETYGVHILIGDQCHTQFGGHYIDLLLEEADLTIALDTLEQALASYPVGFFSQLPFDSHGIIEIQVAGMLKKDTSTQDVIYISQGFVQNTESKVVMVLDARGTYSAINQPLLQTIYHETSHMIDRHLDFRALHVPGSVYSEEAWLALNPEGFAYNNSYYGLLDPQYADYFVDAYACTNSTEDRARVMEYAAMGKTEVFDGHDGLIRKLAFYSQGIRDGFDTTGWPEATLWEETLQNLTQ